MRGKRKKRLGEWFGFCGVKDRRKRRFGLDQTKMTGKRRSLAKVRKGKSGRQSCGRSAQTDITF